MKSLHSIPTEFKSKKVAQMANFVMPTEVARGLARYLSVSTVKMRVHVHLPINQDDPWRNFAFEYRFNRRYARWRYMSFRTLQLNAERWAGEQPPSEDRLEIIFA